MQHDVHFQCGLASDFVNLRIGDAGNSRYTVLQVFKRNLVSMHMTQQNGRVYHTSLTPITRSQCKHADSHGQPIKLQSGHALTMEG